MNAFTRTLVSAAAILGTAVAALAPAVGHAEERVAEIKMFAPENVHRVGIGGFGWFIDLEIEFDLPLERTGFTGFQLTGPGAHNNVGPIPACSRPARTTACPA